MTPANYFTGSVSYKNIGVAHKGFQTVCRVSRCIDNTIDDRLRNLLKTKVCYYRQIPNALALNTNNSCIPTVENRRTIVRGASGEYLASVPVVSLLIEGQRLGVLKKMPIRAMKEQALLPLISLLWEEQITHTRFSEQEVEQVIETTLDAIKA
jgi:hypothetical protein